MADSTDTDRPARDVQSERDIEFHRRVADTYDDVVTRHFAVYHRAFLEPFLDGAARTHPGGRVADLGAGTGVVTLALARRGLDVVAIDHSQEMLDVARASAERAGVSERCTFIRGDVRALPFRDSELDGVTCQGLLHHLDDVRGCVAEAVRVLAPGGFVYISEPVRNRPAPFRALSAAARLGRRRAGDDVAPGEAPLDARELVGVLRACGLDFSVEYALHFGRLRRLLGERAFARLTQAASFPWRRRGGDLVFVYGRKR